MAFASIRMWGPEARSRRCPRAVTSISFDRPSAGFGMRYLAAGLEPIHLVGGRHERLSEQVGELARGHRTGRHRPPARRAASPRPTAAGARPTSRSIDCPSAHSWTRSSRSVLLGRVGDRCWLALGLTVRGRYHGTVISRWGGNPATGRMCANALRALQVGNALASCAGPATSIRSSRVASVQLSATGVPLDEGLRLRRDEQVLIEAGYSLQISVSRCSISSQYRSREP